MNEWMERPRRVNEFFFSMAKIHFFIVDGAQALKCVTIRSIIFYNANIENCQVYGFKHYYYYYSILENYAELWTKCDIANVRQSFDYQFC